MENNKQLEINVLLEKSRSKKEDIFRLEQNSQSDLLKEIKKEKLKSSRQDRKERKRYAKSTFEFLRNFTIAILLLVFLSSLRGNGKYGFHISDSVLITLITTSLATITGIFIVVMKYHIYSLRIIKLIKNT